MGYRHDDNGCELCPACIGGRWRTFPKLSYGQTNEDRRGININGEREAITGDDRVKYQLAESTPYLIFSENEDKENEEQTPKRAKTAGCNVSLTNTPTPRMKRQESRREPNHNVQQVIGQDYDPLTGKLYGFSFKMRDQNKTTVHLNVTEARKLDEHRVIAFVEFHSLYKHKALQWMLNPDIDRTEIYSKNGKGQIAKINFFMKNGTNKIVTSEEAKFMDRHRVQELGRAMRGGWTMDI